MYALAHPSKLADMGVSDLKLEDLCANIVENAVIATSYSEDKRIMITFGLCGDVYEICVHDSSIPFKLETLANLGIKKASTHLDEGGSGIGYITAFEILREFNASLIITEYDAEQNNSVTHGFSKSVAIQFDGKSRYIVETHRADMLRAVMLIAGRTDGSMSVVVPR